MAKIVKNRNGTVTHNNSVNKEDIIESTENEVRVIRIIEYKGERKWVEDTVAKAIHGVKQTDYGTITVATLGLYPEVLNKL